jgi:hypothetical protein
MKLTEIAKQKIRRSGEVSWFESLTKSQQEEIKGELKRWGNGPLSPFALAVIEKFKLNRKIPCIRETLRAIQNGKLS